MYRNWYPYNEIIKPLSIKLLSLFCKLNIKSIRLRAGMGAFLDKPNTDKHNESGQGNGLSFGLSSMQGWRIEMEDAHAAVLGLPNGLKEWSFFAVFDGHAGSKVSQHCSENLLQSVLDSDQFKKALKVGEIDSAVAAEGMRVGFLTLDDKMRNLPELQSGEDKSGSTAICAIISPTHIYFGNCGDSRGILVRNKEVEFATIDHKPMIPKERERIQNAGGNVMIQRVNGSLAVSRALGDYEYKNVKGKGPCEQLVSPEPEIFSEERNTDKDEFIVLACDGIWDVIGNYELCCFIRQRMQVTEDLAQICNEIIDTCLYKGSRDNMSIILIALSGCPKVSEDAVKQEEELNKKIETKIKEIVETCETKSEADLPYVLHMLSTEELPGLPPGGGLCAKRSLIEEIHRKLVPEKDSSISSEENVELDDIC